MVLNKSFNNLRMDQTRLPRDATAVSSTQAQAFQDGEVLADDGASYSTVQGAENAASSWILVPPGTFNETLTIDTAGMDVIGSGYDTLIDAGTSGTAIKILASNVTVRNLSFKSDTGSGNDPCRVAGVANATIENCFVRDSGHFCIDIDVSSIDTSIFNCVFEDSDSAGIVDSGDGRTIVAGCIFLGLGNDNLNIDGDDSLLENNVLLNSGGRGIKLTANDSVASGNRIDNATQDGIEVGGTDCVVVNNRISGSGGPDVDNQGTNTLLDSNNTASAN